jgi:hypothetical protein
MQTWGTDSCPQGAAKAYDGYVMAEHGGYRSEFLCVDKGKKNRIARKTCNPLRPCPPSTGNLKTFFTFGVTWNADGSRPGNDFRGGSVGGQELESGAAAWTWMALKGDHSGVVERTADTGTASIYTECLFNTASIAITMDILLRSQTNPSSLSVMLGGMTLATITSGDEAATVVTFNGASSNIDSITMPASQTELTWTNGWIIQIDLAVAPNNEEVKLRLEHSAGGSPSVDIAVDNLDVNGVCGTEQACVCDGTNLNAAAGRPADHALASDGHLELVQAHAQVQL